MVFIGPRGVAKTSTRGLFHCPQCDISRAYAYRRIRRFFVFLSVPVIPLAGEREFVQCGFCRRAFRPSILETHQRGSLGRAGPDAEMPAGSDPELAGAAAATLLVWEED
jgi:hypothetical protein